MEHLKEIVIDYVKKDLKSRYALMITGAWGSGKTHYLKYVLKPTIEEIEKDGKHLKVLYVSLNGVSSFSDIYEQLLSEKFKVAEFFNNNKVARIGLKIFKSATGVLVNAAKFTSGIPPFGQVDPNNQDIPSFAAEDFINFSNCIVVFDDLERISSKINVEDIIGFINTNFVEHDNIKVIILSNQDQIGNDKFSIIKEKVIGRVIQYEPNTEEVLKEHIESLEETDEGFKPFLTDNLEFILEKISLAEIKNLRTVFFFLDNLKQIHQVLTPEILAVFTKKIITSVLVFSNEYKLGRLDKYKSIKDLPYYLIHLSKQKRFLRVGISESGVQFQKEEDEYFLKYGEYNSRDYILIHPVFKFIKTGHLVENELTDFFNEKLPKNLSDENQAFNNLTFPNVTYLEDELFNNYLSVFIDAIVDKKFSLSRCVDAFYVLKSLLDEEVISSSEIQNINSKFNIDIESFLIQNLPQDNSLLNASDIRELERWIGIHANEEQKDYPRYVAEIKQKYFEQKKAFDLNEAKENFEVFKQNLKLEKDQQWKLLSFITLLSSELTALFQEVISSNNEKLVTMNDYFNESRWSDRINESNVQEVQANLFHIYKEVDGYIKTLSLDNQPVKRHNVKGLMKMLLEVIKDCNKIKEKNKEREQRIASSNKKEKTK